MDTFRLYLILDGLRSRIFRLLFGRADTGLRGKCGNFGRMAGNGGNYV